MFKIQVIDENSKMLKDEMEIREALNYAASKDLDLVLVSVDPICIVKVLDYKKSDIVNPTINKNNLINFTLNNKD